MDRCFEAYQVGYDKKLWDLVAQMADRLPVNDNLRLEIDKLRLAAH
jgi:hypothetical protein